MGHYKQTYKPKYKDYFQTHTLKTEVVKSLNNRYQIQTLYFIDQYIWEKKK